MWLQSSVGRALHRYRGDHGFKSHWRPDFFRLLLSNCLNWKIYCDDHSSLWSTTAVNIYSVWIVSYILHIKSISLCFEDGDRLNPVHGNPNPGKRVHVHDTSSKRGSTFPSSQIELLSSVQTSNFQFDPTMRDPRLELLSKPAATHFEVKLKVNVL